MKNEQPKVKVISLYHNDNSEITALLNEGWVIDRVIEHRVATASTAHVYSISTIILKKPEINPYNKL